MVFPLKKKTPKNNNNKTRQIKQKTCFPEDQRGEGWSSLMIFMVGCLFSDGKQCPK